MKNALAVQAMNQSMMQENKSIHSTIRVEDKSGMLYANPSSVSNRTRRSRDWLKKIKLRDSVSGLLVDIEGDVLDISNGKLRNHLSRLLVDIEGDVLDISSGKIGDVKSTAHQPAKDTNDNNQTNCLNDRQLKSCMKVQTQRYSLANISTLSNLTSITETSKVSFDTVEFREYPRILSDNPSTSSGPAIGIGWYYDPQDTIKLDLDEYEYDREGTRRNKKELTLPKFIREDMLLEVGYSHDEICNAVKSSFKTRQQRMTSVELQKFDPLAEKAEAVKDGFRSIMTRTRSSSISSLRSSFSRSTFSDK